MEGIVGAEDCLYLDVTVPRNARPGQRLPVLVWLHGGGFVSGAAQEYDGTELATVGDRWLPRATLILGLGYLPMLLTSPLPAMAVWVAVSGLALPAVLTSVFVAADRVAPPGTAAESFAWVATAFLVGSAAGSAVDGVLLDATGVLTAGFAPAPLVILTAAGLLWLRRLDRPGG